MVKKITSLMIVATFVVGLNFTGAFAYSENTKQIKPQPKPVVIAPLTFGEGG
jgi:hypothetical protein